MPIIIDARCPECDFEMELWWDASKGSLPVCSTCGGPLQRVYSAKIASLNKKEALKEALIKRSEEHSLKKLKSIAGHKGAIPQDFGRRGKGIE